MTSGAKPRSASAMPSRVSTRRNVQRMSARRTSRSASAASFGSSSTRRMRTVAAILPRPCISGDDRVRHSVCVWRFPGGRLGWRTTWRYGWVGNRAFLRHGGAPVRHLPREPARASPLLVRRLVQQQPVEPDLRHGSRERLEVHRLDDVAVGAKPIGCRDVGLFARRGEDDDRDGAGALVRLQPSQYFESVDLGELQVEQHDLRHDPDVAQRVTAVAEKEIQSLGAVPGDKYLIREVARLEGAQRQLGIGGVVLHQEDFDLLLVRHRVTSSSTWYTDFPPQSRSGASARIQHLAHFAY